MKAIHSQEVPMIASFTNETGNLVSIETGMAAQSIHEAVFGDRSTLTREQRIEVYLACDGFGDTSKPGPLRDDIREYMNGGWDWSHVRDSSPQGFSRALGLVIKFQKEAA
jgi:hypothetical protein